mgnify:CR=1 FL=1
MEAKKTIRIIFFLIALAIIIFLSVIFINSRIDSKEVSKDLIPGENVPALNTEHSQSYQAVNLPVISADDFVSSQEEKKLDLIVYEDYADLFSADFASSLDQVQSEFGNQVRIAFRPFTVANSDLSLQAALAVRCAADAGQGQEFRDKVFSAVRENKLMLESLVTFASELSLNSEEFQACLTNSEKKEKIGGLMAGAENFSVYGAPAIFIGDEMIVGARPYEAFTDSNGDEIEGLKQVIERQLK